MILNVIRYILVLIYFLGIIPKIYEYADDERMKLSPYLPLKSERLFSMGVVAMILAAFLMIVYFGFAKLFGM